MGIKSTLCRMIPSDDTKNICALAGCWILFLAWFLIVPNGPFATIGLCLTPFVALAFQQYIAGVIHEASHGLFISQNRKVNEILGNWFGAYTFLYDLNSFRRGHFLHHSSNDFFGPDDLETHPASVGSKDLVRSFTNDLLFQSAWMMANARKAPIKEHKRSGGIFIHALILWGCLGWFGSLWFLGAYALTFLTLYLAANRIRIWATHADLSADGTKHSSIARNVLSPTFERVFFGNRLMMYHHEHHQNPRLTFRECERLARQRFHENGHGEQHQTSTPSYLYFAWKLARK